MKTTDNVCKIRSDRMIRDMAWQTREPHAMPLLIRKTDDTWIHRITTGISHSFIMNDDPHHHQDGDDGDHKLVITWITFCSICSTFPHSFPASLSFQVLRSWWGQANNKNSPHTSTRNKTNENKYHHHEHQSWSLMIMMTMLDEEFSEKIAKN